MPSTTRYRRGDIVLVSFPFTDLSSSKRRPALVISPDAFNDRGQDLVLVAITSQQPDDKAISIDADDLVGGTLPKQSFVKATKIFTMHSTLVLKRICAPARREARRRPTRIARILCLSARFRQVFPDRMKSGATGAIGAWSTTVDVNSVP